MIIDENITDDPQFTPQGIFVTGHDLKEFKTQKSLDKAVAREFANNALISFLYNEYISKRNSNLTEREIVGFDIDDKRYKKFKTKLKNMTSQGYGFSSSHVCM